MHPLPQQTPLRRLNPAAHTGAIYVHVDGHPLADRAELAREWIARLDSIEGRLSDERIGEIPIWDWMPYSDGVSEAHLRRHRPALRQAISDARAHYQEIVRSDSVTEGPR